jgi:heterodisulfide reductase subunit B
MLDHLLSAVKESGANCIVTACPMCFNNLDMRQREVEKMAMQKYNLPVFYFTELMGLAFGAEAKKLGLNKHFVDAMPLVNQVIKATGKGETA